MTVHGRPTLTVVVTVLALISLAVADLSAQTSGAPRPPAAASSAATTSWTPGRTPTASRTSRAPG